ncbi:MAG: late control protein [Novosphingobium sp.]|nr:late control protein [Novosphingobium sp.]
MSNVPTMKISLDGKDLSDKINPRLISLTLTEKRDGSADQLDLVLHDHDGRLAIPPAGAVIRLQLGWARGTDVIVGLVDKGTFTVDEATHDGPPDAITIRARSADLSAGFRVRRESTHRDTTLGAIVTAIAGANHLVAKVDPDLAAIAVPVLSQDQKSDMALLRQLGRRHDAIATVKDGKLIFSPIGKATTAGGATKPAVTLIRRQNWTHSYKRIERDANYGGVEARWHDQAGATRHTVLVAGTRGDDKQAKRLKRTFHSEADARAAAEAENRRIVRGAAEFTLDLPHGRPDLYPDRPVTLQGWKAEIDAHRWLIAEISHNLDGAGGLTSKLKLETAA